jgi:hypothetical protein
MYRKSKFQDKKTKTNQKRTVPNNYAVKTDEVFTKTEGSVLNTSVFTANGITPIPALNPSRPFNFTAAQSLSETGNNPFEFGNLQYVSTLFKLDDRWWDCRAFDNNVDILYQRIRETLKSNLYYTRDSLKLYLINTMWIPALVKAMERDLGFYSFSSPKHPNFQKIWGTEHYPDYHNVNCNVSNTLQDRNGVSVQNITRKQYMIDSDYVQNLALFENNLIPRLRMLRFAPTVMNLQSWLFGGVFIDEHKPSNAQLYWNNFTGFPICDWIGGVDGSIEKVGFIDSLGLTLEQLFRHIEWVTSVWGVVIADLSKASNYTTLNVVPPSKYPITFLHDTIYFEALENGYSEHPFESFNTQGFVGDFTRRDLSFVQFDTASQLDPLGNAARMLFMGGLVSPSNYEVSPLSIAGQMGMVYAETPVQLHSSAYAINTSVNTFLSIPPALSPSGAYGLCFSTNVINYLGRVSGDNSIKPESEVSNDDERFVSPGYMTVVKNNISPAYSANKKILVRVGRISDVSNNFNGKGNVYCLIDKELGSGTKVFDEDSSYYDIYFDNPSVKFYFSPNDILNSAANIVDSTDGLTLLHANAGITTVGRVTFRMTYAWLANRVNSCMIEFTGISGKITIANVPVSRFISLIGTCYLGEVTANTILRADPSNSLLPWILGEITHHIPVFQQHAYVTDATVQQGASMMQVTLIKDTKISTLVSIQDLESILFLMYNSLYFPTE